MKKHKKIHNKKYYKLKADIIFMILLGLFLLSSCNGIEKKNSDKVEDVINVLTTDEESIATKKVKQTLENEDVKKSENTVQEKGDEKDLSLEEQVTELINQMTLEEKVAQLFFISPEVLVEDQSFTAMTEEFKDAYDQYPVGGFVLFQYHIIDPLQTKALTDSLQNVSKERLELPAYVGIDEEGGQVTRIERKAAFNVPTFSNMNEIRESNNPNQAYKVGDAIGGYLKEYGFNIDFAPVADVYTNPQNEVVKYRAFSSNPEIVADMTSQVTAGLKNNGVLGTYKHFPGHGDTSTDSHNGYAFSDKTIEELKSCELIPFQRGIDEGIEFIMIGHVTYPNITSENVPSSLSEEIITDLLIKEMGYSGIVITDALNMGAITKEYNSKEVAIKAINSGVDMLLMPEDFFEAYNGLLEGIQSGEVSIERINEAVEKIIRVKVGLS